jgi:hypothetical protein
MKTKILLFVISSLLSFCNSKTQSDKAPSNDSASSLLDSSKRKTIDETSDTVITKENCVLFLMPDTFEINKMKEESSEEDYNEVVADITWYPGIASEVLDSFKINYRYVDNSHILLFQLNNGKIVKFDKRKIEGNMILFRNDSLPLVSYAIGFDRELTLNFFRK